MEQYVPNFKKQYEEKVAPALKEQFNYKNVMQVPKLEKIVINQGIGAGVADKRLVENAVKQLSTIAGQKAVTCYSCLLYTSPSPRDRSLSRMPSSA